MKRPWFFSHRSSLILLLSAGCQSGPRRGDPPMPLAATVAWSGNLEPALRKDVSFKTFLGRGGGDSNRTEFDRHQLRRRPAV